MATIVARGYLQKQVNNQSIEDQIMEDQALVTFENRDGRKIVCTVTLEPEEPSSTIKIDFVPEAKKEDKGLHLALMNRFIDSLS